MRNALVVCLLPALSGCALFTLAATKRSHPTLEGLVDAADLRAPLSIHRDAQGVPHIEAASEAEAWYGLGFVHAQDRLFQLDVSRRIAHGHVSELFGERAIELDAFVGSMNLEALGQQSLDRASPEAKEAYAAYTAGLNAGVASLKVLPVEYRLLDAPFPPFDEADATAVMYMVGWSLQENLDHELASMQFAHLPSEELAALFQTYPDTPPIDPWWEELRTSDFGELSAGFKAFTGALGGRAKGNPEASNNWVVSGERTASGKPILANDPHLVQSVPSLWYAVSLHGGDVHLAGATLPGVPGVPIGHNERVSWGITNVMADTVDLAWLERDGDALIVRGEHEVPELRTVTVHPRDAEPVQRSIPWTSLGPIINEGGDGALVLRWAALETPDQNPDVFQAFAHATSAPTLLEEIATLHSVTPQNLVVADVDGDIGWSVSGSIPRRHGYTGRVPHPASDGKNHWDGFLTEVPGELNPKVGYLATANSKPRGEEEPNVDLIATAYLPEHRYGRIMERLGELPKATPLDMHQLQLDVRDGAAATYLPGLLDGLSPSPEAAPCHALLAAWDYQANNESAAAAVWGVFQEELFRGVLADRFDADQMYVLLDLMSTGRNAMDGDFARFLTDRPAQVDAALARTCNRLTERFGSVDAVRWGDMHPLKLKHPFSAQSKLLEGWDMVTVPYPGTGACVSAADFEWIADEWKVGFMASMRIVIPMDDVGAATFVHPGGQSGQPRSPYYRSHYNAFVAGDTLPLWFDDDDVKAHAVHTLVLQP